MDQVEKVKKIVIVGDSGCGKTCLLLRYATKEFEPGYQPTVFEKKEIVYTDEATGAKVGLDLWDTAGQEDYDRIRTLSYLDTDLILVCFSLNSMRSLENIGERWKEEIEHFCKDAPRILVGMKADLRRKTDANLITEKIAIDMARHISAKSYVECSSCTGENVEEVFHMAMDILLGRTRKRKSKQKKCTPV
ncbi:hypothetical protein NECID01_1527 [Nematocida sp. AWRm77]|nr:hypothetical protein NECID01_1527 [Nematocida sp. AWRm77]